MDSPRHNKTVNNVKEIKVKRKRMNYTVNVENDVRTNVEDIINETKEIIPEPTEEELLKNKLYLEVLRKKQLKRKYRKINPVKNRRIT